MQKDEIFGKSCSPPGFEPGHKSVALPNELFVLCFLMECCLTLLFLQPAAKCKLITALTCCVKLEVGG